ncbi:MAG TPA: VIT domain-containing protein, partial [Polyangiaceae bacterium]|nr:VIT domain-containing protein [Polyangiaceae bacterium]
MNARATALEPTPQPRLDAALLHGERPIELAELRVFVEASGALVVTTWELWFFNPNARELEGRLEFPLLAGQSVVRFAMDVNGRLREAVPVPKDKGRQVFEEVVRQRVDPALLERTAGHGYRARVYPLVPGQLKRVVLAYQEETSLRDGEPAYRLALDFPSLRRFSLELVLGANAGAPRVLEDTLGLGLPAWGDGREGREGREGRG